MGGQSPGFPAPRALRLAGKDRSDQMEEVPGAIQRRTQTSLGEGKWKPGRPPGGGHTGFQGAPPRCAPWRSWRSWRSRLFCERKARAWLARPLSARGLEPSPPCLRGRGWRHTAAWGDLDITSREAAGAGRRSTDPGGLKHLEQADPRRRKAEQRLPGAFFCLFFHTGGRVSVWDDEHVWGQMAVMVTRHRTCTSCHGAADFKMVKLVHVTLCLFYCNTRIFSLKRDSRTGALCSNRDESQNRKKNVA